MSDDTPSADALDPVPGVASLLFHAPERCAPSDEPFVPDLTPKAFDPTAYHIPSRFLRVTMILRSGFVVGNDLLYALKVVWQAFALALKGLVPRHVLDLSNPEMVAKRVTDAGKRGRRTSDLFFVECPLSACFFPPEPDHARQQILAYLRLRWLKLSKTITALTGFLPDNTMKPTHEQLADLLQRAVVAIRIDTVDACATIEHRWAGDVPSVLGDPVPMPEAHLTALPHVEVISERTARRRVAHIHREAAKNPTAAYTALSAVMRASDEELDVIKTTPAAALALLAQIYDPKASAQRKHLTLVRPEALTQVNAASELTERTPEHGAHPAVRFEIQGLFKHDPDRKVNGRAAHLVAQSASRVFLGMPPSEDVQTKGTADGKKAMKKRPRGKCRIRPRLPGKERPEEEVTKTTKKAPAAASADAALDD